MIRTITFILLLLLLTSCHNKLKTAYASDIIGEWQYVEPVAKPIKEGALTISLPPRGTLDIGYEFFDDGTFEYKTGYFRYTKRTDNSEANEEFLGTKSAYKINEDNLRIYDLETKKWESYKIVSIANDTLQLCYPDKSISKFKRNVPKNHTTSSYDKVIVSSSGCYGTCPVTDIEIDKSGEVFFYGSYYSNIKGYYKSKITAAQFEDFNTTFLKADWENLENDYDMNITDSETIYVTFIKDGKIIKTITDYNRAAPSQLNWAYTPLRFLQQKLNLTKIENEIDFLNSIFLKITHNKQYFLLRKSEAFYLINLVLSSKKTDAAFTEKYEIRYGDNELNKKIVTDGRFYKFEKSKGDFVTYDLGYDFIVRNNLNDLFEAQEN